MSRKKPDASVPLNFLLTCSERTLGNYELMRLAAVSDLRSELFTVLDRLVNELAQAGVAAFFRNLDRDALKRAIENPEDAVKWAKVQIQRRGRTDAELVPRPALAPGSAHIAASLLYQQRNIAAGKCAVCPKPLGRNSVRFCTTHLEQARERMRAKAKKLSKPPHGRAPGTLKALTEAREEQKKKSKANRETLAAFGVSAKTLVG